MMRKKYLKPKVESESSIEQTSLACNVIQGWEIPGEIFYTGACLGDVTKGGSWWDQMCAVGVFADVDFGEGCYPDTYGIPLS